LAQIRLLSTLNAKLIRKKDSSLFYDNSVMEELLSLFYYLISHKTQ